MKPSIAVDELRRVFADVFEIPQGAVRPASSPDNIETWDSIHHLNLVVALEQEFGVQFEPEEIEQLLSFELVEALLREKISPDGAGV